MAVRGRSVPDTVQCGRRRKAVSLPETAQRVCRRVGVRERSVPDMTWGVRRTMAAHARSVPDIA
eukprot:3941592-Rhodomonas_salina.1